MARQAGNDGDINRLNETSHYAGAADFERPLLLLPRRVSHTLPPPDAIVSYLAEAGFGDTVPLKDFTFDNSLILALVERWRPETHTFHLPWGEVTITLQDVAYHLGLGAHGNPVGRCLLDFGRWYGTETWAMVKQLLGARPQTSPTTWCTYGGYRLSETSRSVGRYFGALLCLPEATLEPYCTTLSNPHRFVQLPSAWPSTPFCKMV
ncbi:uncharacterized protein DS421_1g00090 [Arachis hypogaea]|nr:uncharacterized protein DS421_1g00090 [Arachis hypogaea]